MDAFADVEFLDRAVLVEDTLVLADLHLGKVAASTVQLPVGEGTAMVDRLRELCADVSLEAVVVAGDLLHSFESVPRLVEDSLAGLLQVADDYDIDLVVTPGNHDTMLEAVWAGETTPEYRVGDTLVCHGHVEPAGSADRYVVGHDHPTISLEGTRRPCFLAGEGCYEGADVLVLPAFNRLLAGVEVNEMSAADFMSPLVRDADALAPVVSEGVDGEPLVFPPLGTLRHKL